MLTFTLRSVVQIAIGLAKRHVLPASKATQRAQLRARFRLYPINMDVYGHMNNACYLRVAELSRWR